MISQILNRRFILEQLEDVKAELEQQAAGGVPRRGADHVPDGAQDLTTDDYRIALQQVSKSLEQEDKESSGQMAFDEPEDQRRRGQEAAEIDDFSFFSRDPVISNLQSALEAYFETHRPEALTKIVPGTDNQRRGSGGPPAAAEYNLEGSQPRRDVEGRRVFDSFSVTDPKWVSSALAMGIRWFKNKHEFVARPATPKPIANRSRVLMVGDWGSGLPRARRLADQMRKIIDQGIASGLQQHVIHLGDIYYSGWKREVENRFLQHWPVRPEEADAITSWSVNANHDMYSGGHGYFETLLGDPRFQGHGGSSLFSLVNRHWRILGLDSAWEEHRLKEPQPQWIRDQVREAEHDGQKVMLLSHHQPFSAFEKGGEHLVASLGELLESPKIHAWFWGHEHRCALYKEHMNIPFGRLLGHGGVPVYQWKTQDEPIPEPAMYEYRGRFRKGLEQWALFGFAVLDFDGPNIEVRYINELGDEHYRETIGSYGAMEEQNELHLNPRRVPRGSKLVVPTRKKLYVGNLSYDTSSADLEALLSAHGTVQNAEVVSDRATGQSKGFGFVEMDSDEEAQAAIAALNGQQHGGRALTVIVAKPRASHGGGVRGGGESAAPPSQTTDTVESVRRTPHMDVNTAIPIQPGSEFQVHIFADRDDVQPEEHTQDIVIHAPRHVEEFNLDVWLITTEHFDVLRRPTDNLVIRRQEPSSNRLAYTLRAKTTNQLHSIRDQLPALNKGSITACFAYSGQPCGRVGRVVELDVPEQPEHRLDQGVHNRAMVPKPRSVVDIRHGEKSPDMLVQITEDEQINDGRLYHCRVVTSLGQTDGSWRLRQGTTANAVMSYMSNFTKKGKSSAQLVAALRGAGIEMFKASPENFKAAFWRLIDADLAPETIQIVTEEPHFLWELMLPTRGTDRRLPLGVEFSVARWITGDGTSPRQSVPITDSYVVAPVYTGSKKLAHAEAEAALICKKFSGEQIRPATFDNIRSRLQEKPVSLLHFACHGKAKENDVEQTLELVDGGELTVIELSGDNVLASYFRTRQPIVFLNACEVGRQQVALAGAGGFPAAMIGLGARAVIAPAWAVKDTIGHEVAIEFYSQLEDSPDKPFASILRDIRKRAYDQGEDTYAAYCFYGHVQAARRISSEPDFTESKEVS